MLRTRLIIGALLLALGAGVLVGDADYHPHYPFLLGLLLLLTTVASLELRHLLPGESRPSALLCLPTVWTLVVVHWLPGWGGWAGSPWELVAGVLIFALLGAFALEIARYNHDGTALPRMGATLLLIVYLGVLPGFLVQLRFSLPSAQAPLALALAIFVPKFCDIGAYFAGQLLGRHLMAPVLSPKKTWQGVIGGLLVASLTALGVQQAGLPMPGGALGAVLFGLVLGVVAIVGDLAESLIKRECQAKDASQFVPGFGGVLDVVDSIIYTAPVVYWWLRYGPL
jgi:phosphatidate cytidylyltransferase